MNRSRQTLNNREYPTCNAKPDCGFTLLEIMVAVSIIAIVLVSVYKLHAQTISMNTITKFYVTAPLLAQSKLAELETTPSDQKTSDSGDFGEAFPGYTWRLSIDDVESELLEIVAEDLKRVDLTVSFGGDENIYNIRTYMFFRNSISS